MIRILSEKEVEAHNRSLDEWWNKIDYGTKGDIKNLLQPFIDKYETEHFCYNKNEHLLHAARGVYLKNEPENEIPVVYCERTECDYRIENDKELWLRLRLMKKEK